MKDIGQRHLFSILFLFCSFFPLVSSLSSHNNNNSRIYRTRAFHHPHTPPSSPPSSPPPPRPIKKVVVVGGTHGNEYTGVWCIKALERKTHHLTQTYPSLEIETLLANPQAHYENKRFIDADLNRQFSKQHLLKNMEGEEGLPLTVEQLRAQEVNEILGPKFGVEHPCTDVIVDLHSTTTNMGICLIVPEGDVEMVRAAAYVAYKCDAHVKQQRKGGKDEEEEEEEEEEVARILVHSITDRNKRPNLGSIARHGFTVEVGPVPQGVLRHDAVEKTEMVLHYLLEYLELLNNIKKNNNKDDNDSTTTKTVVNMLQKWYPNGQVSVYRSAKSHHKNQIAGKIQWPSDPDNPNFPKYLVHKSLQDCDFHKIKKGDALFVDLDGKVIPYSGSHGKEVYLIFVNEGGYYYSSSGTGIGVAVKRFIDVEDGFILKCEEEEEESAHCTVIS